MFFFYETATTEIYTYCHTLSRHDALPISRLQRTGGLGGLDHPGRDPVLDRAARVEIFHLRQEQGSVLCLVPGQVEGALEPQQRSVADEVEERVHVVHALSLAAPVRFVPPARRTSWWTFWRAYGAQHPPPAALPTWGRATTP